MHNSTNNSCQMDFKNMSKNLFFKLEKNHQQNGAKFSEIKLNKKMYTIFFLTSMNIRGYLEVTKNFRITYS